MERSPNRFFFTSFASEAESRPLLHTLQKINPQIEQIPAASISDIYNPGVPHIFLFGDPGYRPDNVLSYIASSPSLATLAVFAGDPGGWDNNIVNRCTEIVSWPCREAELSMRLDRVNSTRSCGIADVDDAKLAEEFVDLNLVGQSPAFLEALRLVKKVSACEAPVLIEGETGTGKELAARAIHYLGKRRDYPFIPVNCGSLPDNLVENELFGHEKGAYTDARTAQKGLFDQARGGTIFLDEVDSLSLKAQVSLLRFLQDQEFRPLGSEQSRRADVRIVAASNANLFDLVQQGRFREDLLYRLHILAIELPSLKTRGKDVVLLAEYFLDVYQQRYGGTKKYLNHSSKLWLKNHDWPGNVRELENLIHRQYLLSEGDEVVMQETRMPRTERRCRIYDRRDANLLELPFAAAKQKVVSDFEKNYLHSLLQETSGNVSEAARRAGKERRALGKLLYKHGINKTQYS